MRTLDAEKTYRLLNRIAAVAPIYRQWAKQLRQELRNGGVVDEQRFDAIGRLGLVIDQAGWLVETFEEMPADAQGLLLEAERAAGPEYLASWKPCMSPRSRQIHVFSDGLSYHALESDDSGEIEEARRREEESSNHRDEPAKKPKELTPASRLGERRPCGHQSRLDAVARRRRRPEKPVDPSWLCWNDGTVLKLARTIAAERTFATLPILADALEEAGCTDSHILAHCRQPGRHRRDCWVINLLPRNAAPDEIYTLGRIDTPNWSATEDARLLRDRIYAVVLFTRQMAGELEAAEGEEAQEKLMAVDRLHGFLCRNTRTVEFFEQLPPECQAALLEAERRAGPEYLAKWERQLFPPAPNPDDPEIHFLPPSVIDKGKRHIQKELPEWLKRWRGKPDFARYPTETIDTPFGTFTVGSADETQPESGRTDARREEARRIQERGRATEL